VRGRGKGGSEFHPLEAREKEGKRLLGLGDVILVSFVLLTKGGGTTSPAKVPVRRGGVSAFPPRGELKREGGGRG